MQLPHSHQITKDIIIISYLMIQHLTMIVQRTKLTDVDPPAVSLHQQEDKHMQWNKVDDENIATPCRDLGEME